MSTYAEVAAGEYAAIEDAWGWITVIRFEANAAAELGVRPGDAGLAHDVGRLSVRRRCRRNPSSSAPGSVGERQLRPSIANDVTCPIEARNASPAP